MFRIITEKETIQDRLLINVTPFNGSINLPKSKSTKFIAAKGIAKGSIFDIKDNNFFAVATTDKLKLDGRGVIIEMPGYSFNETYVNIISSITHGHLSYIDGCSNSNLVNPPRNGDPCLNYLFFPPSINQTFHTHPSVRIGFVLSGNGIAETSNGEFALTAGDVFILDRMGRHRFKTQANSSMSLIAFHPDSDDGPKDEFNPMKTRTYI